MQVVHGQMRKLLCEDPVVHLDMRPFMTDGIDAPSMEQSHISVQSCCIVLTYVIIGCSPDRYELWINSDVRRETPIN